MDHDLPDREEIACALEVMESRLARQGQYDQAVDVFIASKLLRLDDDEITRLRAENEALRAENAKLEADVVWAARNGAWIKQVGMTYHKETDQYEMVHALNSRKGSKGVDGTDADLLRAVREARTK